jgi:hypothetical protein
MLKHRQTRIVAIVAVGDDGAVLAPCGRCRELIRQTDPAHWNTRIHPAGQASRAAQYPAAVFASRQALIPQQGPPPAPPGNFVPGLAAC